jgi:hypothetical protein
LEILQTGSDDAFERRSPDYRRQLAKKDQTNMRGLSRRFCRRLKDVFKMAAEKSSHSEAFGQYYENLLDGGTRPALAQVSLARKIAVTAFQTDFDVRRSDLNNLLKFKQFRTSNKLDN